jgi:tetratricopeptide (TPR) repeat protein|tara:strand:+ start:648 stop:1454 length:807 start_codon:yes stop_codon:yes gene_type:complete
MIKPIFTGIIGLVILFSIQTTYAQEVLLLPEGKNVKEWESISAVLVTENRFNEAIIYLDKILDQEPNNLKALSNKAVLLIELGNFSEGVNLSNKVLEIDPDRISTLTNKAIALKMLKEYEESYAVLTKILIIEPKNEEIKQARANLLSFTPTISTNNSEYSVHVLVIVRDENEKLIAVTESTNSRYLDSKFTERWWNDLDKKEYISHENGFEKYQKSDTTVSNEDHFGMATLEVVMHETDIVVFEAFLPMIQIAETDTVTIQWTIIKK